jgi:hypothetical protein
LLGASEIVERRPAAAYTTSSLVLSAGNKIGSRRMLGARIVSLSEKSNVTAF